MKGQQCTSDAHRRWSQCSLCSYRLGSRPARSSARGLRRNLLRCVAASIETWCFGRTLPVTRPEALPSGSTRATSSSCWPTATCSLTSRISSVTRWRSLSCSSGTGATPNQSRNRSRREADFSVGHRLAQVNQADSVANREDQAHSQVGLVSPRGPNANGAPSHPFQPSSRRSDPSVWDAAQTAAGARARKPSVPARGRPSTSWSSRSFLRGRRTRTTGRRCAASGWPR